MEPWYTGSSTTLYNGDSLAVLRALPDCSVQCCVTSPPYWALRDYGVEGQLGLEATPEEYVANIVALFREVRRVLRDDGTLWLNIGDTYSVGRGASQGRDPRDSKNGRAKDVCRPNDKPLRGLKQKDLVGIPWMVAFALRADGWYLRAENIWAKRSPMPDSTKDRPTKAHEQVFLLTKSARYFYDYVGSQEPATTRPAGNKTHKGASEYAAGDERQRTKAKLGEIEGSATRNMRSVWSISSYPLKAAHFAAYPPELVRKCLTAGVSPRGCCPNCGTPWSRQVERRRMATRPGTASKVGHASRHDGSPYHQHNGSAIGNRDRRRHVTELATLGWKPGCSCDPLADGSRESLNGGYLPVPCVVLDPFHGAGTTWKVCQRLGLRYVGIELNEEYLRLSVERPPVTFPHERKQSKPRRVRRVVTPMLKGFE